MTLAASILFAATMTLQEAIVTLLNSPSSTSVARYNEAVSIVKRDADAGKPLQQYVLGVTTKDKALAKKYVEASREKIRQLATGRNNALAWYLLSLETNDLQLLGKAAAGGNVQALNAYGTILIQGAFDRNVSSNVLEGALSKGYECFRKAAALKDPNGYINLGTCYMRGFGCDINLKLAHECFKSAAEAGHPEGMDYLSANYELGHGVRKNAAKSLFWRMKAKALRGDPAAVEWLKTGKGGTK